MTTSDFIGLALSYAYAAGLLVVGAGLRRLLGLPPELTRKLIHVGAGMWIFGILALFDRWQIGILPFATFIGFNYLLYRYRVLEAMDSADSSPGTVYFAVSVTVLFALLWRPEGPVDRAPIAAAGAMAMTWGDALAALIGQRFGQHRYQIWGSAGETSPQGNRSWEGSAVMFLVSAIAIFLVLYLLPGSSLSRLAIPWSMEQALSASLVGAAGATLAEAVSPQGTDNLSVPLVAAAILWGLRLL